MATPATDPTWFEHVDLMQAALVIALAIIVFFAKRTLTGIDKNQAVLFDKHDDLENKHNSLRQDFNQLKGEHIATHYGRREGDIK